MVSLPGLRPVAAVTLQVGGSSLRAGLCCDIESFSPDAVETFVLLLHRCTRCLFTCAESGHMITHLSTHVSPTHLSSTPNHSPSHTHISSTPNHSPSHAHIISASQEFMQTGDKEDEDLFLYDMFDISAQGEELQEAHTCQVSSLFEEHCSLFKEERDQSAHLRTLGLCRISASKSPPRSPPKSPPSSSCRTDKTPGSTEKSRRRSRPARVPRVHLKLTKTDPRVQPIAQTTAHRPVHTPLRDFRKRRREPPTKSRDVGDDKKIIRRKKLENLQKEPSFTCSVCKRTFSSALTLRRHAGVHSDLRPFSCSLCPYSSRLRASLLQHQRTHTGERPFGCPVCSYASIDRSSLLRHQRLHNNERPHCCPHCDYCSIQKKSLDLHLQRHHHHLTTPDTP
ncbi:zinc finger protein Xfin-like isoform X1 [Periophthalmus magnuspinnatus]|uniref:zinc finger protein Xfin-like isoform X1 n=1 Tax=Periophthalmus magnuspinnatus TaxID=409849 RepID=UPI0024369BF0|nr:zinc finger protein Xfin-like isoform X1 [Periophthalmus magnuspinnatus]